MKSADYFNQVAGSWDTMRRDFFPEAVRERIYALAGVRPGNVIADIGAGTGFITEGLAGAGVNVIAVDYSQKMLTEMQKRLSHHKYIDYRQGESENLPVADNSVDFVMANMYLHHVPDPLAAIKEMARIIKVGGQLILTDLDAHQFDFLKTEHMDTWMGFDRQDIKRWFEAVGLNDTYIDCVGEDCCAKSSCGCDEANVSIFIAAGTK